MGVFSWHRVFILGGMLALMASPALVSLAQPPDFTLPAPPPEPIVRPFIATDYPDDADRNRLADALENRAAALLNRAQAAATAAERQAAQADLGALVPVELVFDAQITQAQINAFQALGGRIDHVYHSVSYGWNGRVPLGKVKALAAAMGAGLVLVEEPKRVVLHMDLATQTGRVRPVWAPGFAGSMGGFDGDPTITIAIIDSGVDGSHTDLAGRQQFWKDYTTDSFGSSRDLIQHGSHVAGIALGTGAAAGSATGTLFYSDEGSLSGVASGSFYPSPIGLPVTPLTFSITARWVGGGTTTLHLAHRTNGSNGNWTSDGSATGASPLSRVTSLTPSTGNAYSPALLSNGTVSGYVVASTVTNYPGVGDGFNKFRGVAPDCRWAGAKVFADSGSGQSTWIGAAIDELVTLRTVHNIKVMNMSLGIIGTPGKDATLRQKVNTAVNNGIVMVVSAGNDGEETTAKRREIDDPGRAAMALTVAASNDVNALTSYTSQGFSSPGPDEDYKPDLMAPGGSTSYYTCILSVDSNTGDGPSFADQQANDYYNIQGTSMASPFAAGCAALVIDAMQQNGVTWQFTSAQARYVKMVLCATASESNANREGNSNNPTLQRAGGGPSGFPAGKDLYEGYGLINPDAAVEAVSLTYTPVAVASGTLGPGVTDRRAWARSVTLPSGTPFVPTLAVPATGDFDLYLYSGTPSSTGTPVLLASSTNTASGAAESFSYTPATSTTAVLVVKRVSGLGSFTLTTASSDTTAPIVINVTATNANGAYGLGATIGIQVTFSESVTVTGVPQLTLATAPTRMANYASGSGTNTLLFNHMIQAGDTAADLDYAGTTALSLNGGTIHDAAGNNAILTLPAPGGSGSLSFNKNIAIDASIPGDFDDDGDVDSLDLPHFINCALGPGIAQTDPFCAKANFDLDSDVDQDDFGVWQRCLSGNGIPGNPDCIH